MFVAERSNRFDRRFGTFEGQTCYHIAYYDLRRRLSQECFSLIRDGSIRHKCHEHSACKFRIDTHTRGIEEYADMMGDSCGVLEVDTSKLRVSRINIETADGSEKPPIAIALDKSVVSANAGEEGYRVTEEKCNVRRSGLSYPSVASLMSRNSALHL